MPVLHRRRRLIPADLGAGVALEPAALFAAWLAEREDAFWLDSSGGAGASLLGWGDPFPAPAAPTGGAAEGAAPPGLYDRIDALLGPISCPEGPDVGAAADPLRSPVLAGWIGYEAAVAEADPALAARLRPRGEEAGPGAGLIRVRRAVRFDPAAGTAEAIGAGPDEGAAAAELAALLAELSALRAPGEAMTPPPAPRAAAWDDDRASYLGLIAACHDRIRVGDAYQLCLTTRARLRTEEAGAAVHLRLRALAPAPYGAFVRTAGVDVSAASPELFLDVALGADGPPTVTTRPIKGTRPRHPDAEADAALGRELVQSPKERAENLMIVDLMRNDLGRLAPDGTAEVPDLLRVEPHPTVHQLVSTVRARLRPGTTVGQLLRSTLPAGSMTGAPKRSAVAILGELEGTPRGAYAGCVGVFGAGGSARLAMTIRCVVLADGIATVGAGGGITILSDPGEEWEEVLLKARAPLAALGVETAGLS